MNVVRICTFLEPLITAAGAGQYVAARPARKMEPDPVDRDADLPLALVHPWKEEALPTRYDNFVKQRSNEQFAVITICAIDALEDCRNRVFAALLGKVLPTYIHDITYVSGETLGIDASVIWWRDIYMTARERAQT